MLGLLRYPACAAVVVALALSEVIGEVPPLSRFTMSADLPGRTAAVLQLRAYGVPRRDNVETLAEHARFVVRELYDGRENRVSTVNYSQPGRYHDEEDHLARIVPIDVVRPHVTAAARILREAGLLEVTGSCGFPACVVSEVAELAPWRAPASFDAHHRSARSHALAACRGCAVREQCIGVRHEYATLHGERGLVPYREVPTSDWYERLQRGPLRGAWVRGETGGDG